MAIKKYAGLDNNYLPTDGSVPVALGSEAIELTVTSGNVSQAVSLAGYDKIAFVTEGDTNTSIDFLELLGSETTDATLEIVKDVTASSGYALKLTGIQKLVFGTRISYVPDILKKVTLKAKKDTGNTGNLYASVVSYANGQYINKSGNISIEDYVSVVDTSSLTTSYTTNVGYVKGVGTNYIEPASNPNSPSELPATTDEAALILEATGASDIWYIDVISLEEVENDITNIPEGENLLGFTLTPNPSTIAISARGDLITEQIVIHATNKVVSLSGALWTTSDGTLIDIEVSPGIISENTKILDCTTIEDENVIITISNTYKEKTYTSECFINKYYETTAVPIYLGAFDTAPAETPYGSFVEGDYFLYTGETGGVLTQYHVYEYTGIGWTETTNPKHIQGVSGDALAIAADTGNVIYAANAFLDTLYANVVNIRKALNVNYAEDENGYPIQGMYVADDGILKAKSAILVDADLRGLINSAPLSTQNEEVSDLSASAVTAVDSLWSEADFFTNFPATVSNQLQNVTFSYDGSSYTKATKLSTASQLLYNAYTSSTKSITDVMGGNITHIGDYTVPASMPDGDDGANYVRVAIHAGWHIAGTPIIELWRGGVKLASGKQSSYTREIRASGDYLRPGDILKCYWDSSAFTFDLKVYMTGQSRSIQTHVGIIGLKSDNTTVDLGVATSGANKYHSFAFSTTSPAWNINSHLSRKSGDDIYTAVTSFPLDNYVQATGTVNGITITGVKRSSNYVQFLKSDGSSIIINRFIDGTNIGVYTLLAMSAIATFSQKEAVLTGNVYPKDSTGNYDLGQAGVVVPGGIKNRYYRNLYLTGTGKMDKLDTGQGANELYPMNQAVQTTDSPTFNNITATGSEGVRSAGARTAGTLSFGLSATFRSEAENPALGTSYRVKKKGTYTFKFSYKNVEGSTTEQFYYRFSINDIPYGNIVTNTASQGLVNVSRNIPLEGNDIIRIHAWSRYNHQIEITKVRIYQNEEGEV